MPYFALFLEKNCTRKNLGALEVPPPDPRVITYTRIVSVTKLSKRAILS